MPGSLDNGEKWVFFNDRVGTETPFSYVTDEKTNQQNCYMAIFSLDDGDVIRIESSDDEGDDSSNDASKVSSF